MTRLSNMLEPPPEQKLSLEVLKPSSGKNKSTFYVDCAPSDQLNCSLQLPSKSLTGAAVDSNNSARNGTGSMPNYARRPSSTSLNSLFVPSHRKSRSLGANGILRQEQLQSFSAARCPAADTTSHDKRRSCDDPLNSSSNSTVSSNSSWFTLGVSKSRCLMDDTLHEEDACDLNNSSECELLPSGDSFRRVPNFVPMMAKKKLKKLMKQKTFH